MAMNLDMIISCDWGSSRFRMRLVDCRTCASQKEVHSDDGIVTLRHQLPGGGTKHLLGFLQQQADRLLRGHPASLENVCIVLSGMASSTIGILELPYAPTPFPVSGKGMISEWKDPSADCRYPLLLLSGVASGEDVMRGEETQLIGIYALARGHADSEGEQLYIFPGTHSKHIHVKDGHVQRFSTFMTGELFALLSQQSILSDSVTRSANDEIDEPKLAAFEAGISASATSAVTNALFFVRTNMLFKRYSREQNYYFLSGVLIGTELAGIEHRGQQLFLFAGSFLHHLYRRALESVGFNDTTIIPESVVDIAAAAGHVEIYKRKYDRR